MAHSACALVRGDTQRSDGYVRRRPEASVLYQVVAKHWPLLLEGLEDAGGLPRFVKQEFEEYLRCGILEHGCLHLVCRQCGLSQVVALSCKKRGFCPACLGRRMADTAVHLERSVLPAVPIRHWICSLPWGLRALLGYDRKLCAGVVSAFVSELSRSLRSRAKHALRLRSVAAAHTGAVAAIQRTDSALRLNVHAHVLALDGVYVRDDETGALVFHPLPTPTRAEVAAVLEPEPSAARYRDPAPLPDGRLLVTRTLSSNTAETFESDIEVLTLGERLDGSGPTVLSRRVLVSGGLLGVTDPEPVFVRPQPHLAEAEHEIAANETHGTLVHSGLPMIDSILGSLQPAGPKTIRDDLAFARLIEALPQSPATRQPIPAGETLHAVEGATSTSIFIRTMHERIRSAMAISVASRAASATSRARYR